MPLRLNLGSGSVPLEGFVNIDALADAPGVDLVADISGRLPFEDGEADVVYAAHVLEHFATDEVPTMLREWRRVLRPGGVLLVAVPDLNVISHMLVERSGWFTPPHNPWLGAIYGGQKDEYDFHKTGFTAPWLAMLLTDAGFGDVRRVGRFAEVGASDTSWSPSPFGKNLSLNMRAVAGSEPMPQVLLQPTGFERAMNVVDFLLQAGMWASTKSRSRVMLRRQVAMEGSMADASERQQDGVR